MRVRECVNLCAQYVGANRCEPSVCANLCVSGGTCAVMSVCANLSINAFSYVRANLVRKCVNLITIARQ